MNQCMICGYNAAELDTIPANKTTWVNCPRCGEFEISSKALAKLDRLDSRRRAIISGLIRDRFQGAHICETDCQILLTARDLSVLEKADRMLLFINERIEHVGHRVDLNQAMPYQIHPIGSEILPSLLSRCWLKDDDEAVGILTLLQEFCRVDLSLGDLHPKILAAGFQRIAELQEVNRESDQGFVAMSFSDEMLPLYGKWIAPAIQQAGYTPFKINDKEFSGSIYDEMILQIRRSRFLVADLSEHKAGVYYEAGFAHGLGLKVFLTCREDYFKNRHFDIAHINCIKWHEDKLAEAQDALARRIEAEIGQGPKLR